MGPRLSRLLRTWPVLKRAISPPNNFVRLNDAVALYPMTVYSYKKSKYNNAPPTATTSVNYSFHPVISKSHPFIASLAALAEKHGGLPNIPDTEKVPEIKSFAVLVKTHRFKTIGEIPDGARAEPSIQGMVVNQISSLGSVEAKLVKQSFPGIDLTKVQILEEGRQPASLFKSLGLVFGSVGLAGLAVAWFFPWGAAGGVGCSANQASGQAVAGHTHPALDLAGRQGNEPRMNSNRRE
ncbi:MAG: hypothetical protein ABFD16_28380 [Thermoguttaceae bacterium]